MTGEQVTTTITEDDLTVAEYAQGSGYGVGIGEVPDRPGVLTVVLLNEDGVVLAELRRFSSLKTKADQALAFSDSIMTAILAGRGDAILTATEITKEG